MFTFSQGLKVFSGANCIEQMLQQIVSTNESFNMNGISQRLGERFIL